MPLIEGKEEQAIYRNNGLGPTFGSGSDLVIPNAPNANNCTAKLNNSYECPAGENAVSFLTGSETFRVDEMEVFGFEDWRSSIFNVTEQKGGRLVYEPGAASRESLFVSPEKFLPKKFQKRALYPKEVSEPDERANFGRTGATKISGPPLEFILAIPARKN